MRKARWLMVGSFLFLGFALWKWHTHKPRGSDVPVRVDLEVVRVRPNIPAQVVGTAKLEVSEIDEGVWRTSSSDGAEVDVKVTARPAGSGKVMLVLRNHVRLEGHDDYFFAERVVDADVTTTIAGADLSVIRLTPHLVE